MTSTALNGLLQREPFVIIGHRGAAALAPENTLSSFALALEHHCQMLELDVHRVSNAPNELAVIHDESLSRTTSDQRLITDLTLADLLEIDAGAGQPIPTLSDVIGLVSAYRAAEVWLNVELKGADTASPVHRCLQQTQFDRVLVSSFEHAQLRLYRQLNADCAIAPLFHRWRGNVLDVAGELDATAVNLSSRIATESRIRKIVDAGYFVMVYTVNAVDEARRLFEWGVKGVFTDNPALVTQSAVVGGS